MLRKFQIAARANWERGTVGRKASTIVLLDPLFSANNATAVIKANMWLHRIKSDELSNLFASGPTDMKQRKCVSTGATIEANF